MNSRETVTETARYKKRHPTKSRGAVQLYSQERTRVLSQQQLAGKVHVTLFAIAEENTTQSQRLAADLVSKIHRFILYFRKLMTEKSCHEKHLGI